VECCAPVNQGFAPGLLPEGCHQGSNEELLREAHAGMGRHFEAAQFDKSESAGGVIRGA